MWHRLADAFAVSTIKFFFCFMVSACRWPQTEGERHATLPQCIRADAVSAEVFQPQGLWPLACPDLREGFLSFVDLAILAKLLGLLLQLLDLCVKRRALHKFGNVTSTPIPATLFFGFGPRISTEPASRALH